MSGSAAADHLGEVGEEVELDVPAQPEYVAVVRLFVESMASVRRCMDPERLADLKLAVSEACTNAIEAYDQVGDDKRVRVSWSEDEDCLEVRVRDHGPGFDPDELPGGPPVGDPDRLMMERGLGIPLIRRLVDSVSFTPSSQGTAVRMVVNCRRAAGAEPAERTGDGGA